MEHVAIDEQTFCLAASKSEGGRALDFSPFSEIALMLSSSGSIPLPQMFRLSILRFRTGTLFKLLVLQEATIPPFGC